MKFKILFIILSAFIFTPTFAEPFSAKANYEICFNPGGHCLSKIVAALNQAKREVLVMAYTFTNKSISDALIKAQLRGVTVKIILDKSQALMPSHAIEHLKNHKILIYVDYKPALSHNKLILIDKNIFIGGSYNFTYGAEYDNAENLLIISDANFTIKYVRYWYKRAKESTLFENYKLL